VFGGFAEQLLVAEVADHESEVLAGHGGVLLIVIDQPR
jgi:hypothetical protein